MRICSKLGITHGGAQNKGEMNGTKMYLLDTVNKEEQNGCLYNLLENLQSSCRNENIFFSLERNTVYGTPSCYIRVSNTVVLKCFKKICIFGVACCIIWILHINRFLYPALHQIVKYIGLNDLI